MTAVQILQEIIGILVGGITSVATGLGQGISSLVTNMFFTVVEGSITGLSSFGMIVCIFAGISLAIALATRIFIMLSKFGK